MHLSCLYLAGVVGGTYLQPVLAGRGLPRPGPLPPGVHRRHHRKLCLLPWSAKDADLHRGHPTMLRPRHPGDLGSQWGQYEYVTNIGFAA
ncbi:hypothetical protein [Streptomyces sp. NPDC006510]|uniref:hypothetical protein n=1 Tax=Streptomyces sp. NPDC006510 TaxID=3155600 RepID=UPI0033AE9F15